MLSPNPFKLTWIIFCINFYSIFDRSILPRLLFMLLVNYRLGTSDNLALPD